MARRTAAIRIQCLARRKAAEGKVTAARSRKAEIERELQAAGAVAVLVVVNANALAVWLPFKSESCIRAPVLHIFEL